MNLYVHVCVNSNESYCSHLSICPLLHDVLRSPAQWMHPATSLQGGWPWDHGRRVTCNDLKRMLQLHVQYTTTRWCSNISYDFMCHIEKWYVLIHSPTCLPKFLSMRMDFGVASYLRTESWRTHPCSNWCLSCHKCQVPNSIEEYSLAAEGVGWQQTSIHDIWILCAWPRTNRYLTFATLAWFATAKWWACLNELPWIAQETCDVCAWMFVIIATCRRDNFTVFISYFGLPWDICNKCLQQQVVPPD